jgi:hypothetical protein
MAPHFEAIRVPQVVKHDKLSTLNQPSALPEPSTPLWALVRRWRAKAVIQKAIAALKQK